LKEGIPLAQQENIKKILKRDLSWEAFKMPFVTMCDSISTPVDEVIEMLNKRYNVRVSYKDKES
jgi:2-hydroxy-3-keto-5-methylthiopentenyl-1-phosphate phosphatase